MMAENQPMIEEMEPIDGVLGDNEASPKESNKSSYFSLGFYQYYFNVSTATVLNRIRRVFLFRLSAAFSLLDLEPFPDMCGPMWIFVTVWLASVVCSDIGDRFVDPHAGQNFSRIFISFFILLGNAIFSLTGLFVAMAGQQVVPVGFPSGSSQSAGNVAHMLSLFGYSLTPFVPAVVMCVFPWPVARWIFLLFAAVFVSLFLIHDMWFIVHNKLRFIGASIYIVAIQVSFCVAMQYFVMGHDYPSTSNGVETTLASNLTSTVAISFLASTTATNSTG